ncbi:extensin family protein [Aquamicrobium sp. LC103]|uniref:extensin-like domain-containing protein n=1 Tax=Aquamicrobium sp. LC103 TaxID=1120658 RepID=UPI0009E241C6|nr:extensin family protein [Aquamicrobium sp. LC103]TKT80390.1 extensin [Aquamicrobium sp. LC103]
MPAVSRNGAAKLCAAFRHRIRTLATVAVLGGGALAFASCSVSSVLTPIPEVDVGVQTASVPARGLQRLVPSNPYMATYPQLDRPSLAPQMTMPAEEIACRKELRRLGVTYRNLAPINDGGACRIDYPVEVTGFSGSVGLKPAATLTCGMAASFAAWTKNELAPAARWRYLSGVKTIHQGSSYSCRNIARSGGVPSEHSKGNALDVMRIELKNGRDIDVRKPGWFAFRERSLLKNVRTGGCDYFTTVLGPGYNADHADHFHFDIKNRKNGYVACR